MHYFSIRVLTVALLLSLVSNAAGQKPDKKYEEPKPQVLPLPAELPMALTADADALDFHISPLLRSGGLSAQIRQSLNDLIRDTHGETIVKLRAFVAGTGDARRVQSEVVGIFSQNRLPFPVLSIIQVGGLGTEAAQVVIEAVVSTHKTVNPDGLAFITGQYGQTFAEAFEHLKKSVNLAHVRPEKVLSATCYTPVYDYEARRAMLQSAFPKTEIDIVQALRSPATDASMCEAVGQLDQAPQQGALVWMQAEHTTLVNTKRLIFTGLQLCFGSFLDDAQEALQRLEKAAGAVGEKSSAVQINTFSLTPAAGSALRKTTGFPPSTFTVQTVEGLTAIDATAGIDAILAPGVESAVLLPQE
jgi:enamine deaminase RidA (YjgF/YER057c/UK114 family)